MIAIALVLGGLSTALSPSWAAEAAVFRQIEGPTIVQAKVQDIDRQQAQPNGAAARKALPARCRTTLRAGGTESVVYRAECLARNLPDHDILPASCETVVRTRDGEVALFKEDCLFDNGWR